MYYLFQKRDFEFTFPDVIKSKEREAERAEVKESLKEVDDRQKWGSEPRWFP